MTWKDLHQANFDFSEPFRLLLGNHSIFYSERTIRILPQKRMVAFGTWHNKPVAAKLFFHEKHSKQHYEKELQGIKWLLENNIPTPVVHLHGETSDGCMYFILFERISSKSLSEIWNERKNLDAIYPTLCAVTTELALQHVLGIVQKDVHLNNFLIQDEKIITLDAGQIEIFPSLLPKKESRNHLALFFSQLGENKYLQEKLFNVYAASRGWMVKQTDVRDLFRQISLWQKKRWHGFKKKLFRDCSQFKQIKHPNYHGMADRTYISLLDESFFEKLISTLDEKEPASSLIMNEKKLIIRRYFSKNILSSLFLKSPAMRDWISTNKKNLLGLGKEKPVAFIEKKYFGICFASYFIFDSL